MFRPSFRDCSSHDRRGCDFAPAAGGAKHVASGAVARAGFRDELRDLRALADARRAEQDEMPGTSPPDGT